ncbi:unnamed protein product, partial [Prorocentrum cordatum]
MAAWRLVPLGWRGRGCTLADGGSASVGRRPSSSVRCEDPRVSGAHCTLHSAAPACGEEGRGPTLEVCDLSANGTYLNGARIGRGQRRLASDGDVLSLVGPGGPSRDGQAPAIGLGDGLPGVLFRIERVEAEPLHARAEAEAPTGGPPPGARQHGAALVAGRSPSPRRSRSPRLHRPSTERGLLGPAAAPAVSAMGGAAGLPASPCWSPVPRAVSPDPCGATSGLVSAGARSPPDEDCGEGTADGILERLMARRAARNAPEQSLASAPAESSAARAKAARLEAIQALQAQMAQLTRVRSAAEATGWPAGCQEPPREPQLQPSVVVQGAGRRPRVGGKRGGGKRTIRVLEPTWLRADAACAAKATDVWEEHAARATADAAAALRRCRGAGPTAAGAAEAAAEVVERLRARAEDEPGRRALMRSSGACPRAWIFEKGRRAVAPSKRSRQGLLPARTIANEFEAATFIPSSALAGLLEAARPGLLGAWQRLEPDPEEDVDRTTGVKDLSACLQLAQGLGEEIVGTSVGRLARAGLTKDYPFYVDAGFDHFVCDACGCWVAQRKAARHNARCLDDAAGRPRTFRQSARDDLGVTVGFKHSVAERSVQLHVDAALEDAARRARSCCYWEPDSLRCEWRLARRPVPDRLALPALSVAGPPGRAVAGPPVRKRRRCAPPGTAGAGLAGGAEEDSETTASEGDAVVCSSGEGGADGWLPGERARSLGVADAQATEAAAAAAAAPPADVFRLRASLDSVPAHQPIAFVRPLTPAQLHTLGWMRQREGEDAGYSSTQTLRQPLAETDVCVEVRISREFKSARGGILADAAGYGKTACVIALVSETRSESLRDMLSVEDWPAAGGRSSSPGRRAREDKRFRCRGGGACRRALLKFLL